MSRFDGGRPDRDRDGGRGWGQGKEDKSLDFSDLDGLLDDIDREQPAQPTSPEDRPAPSDED